MCVATLLRFWDHCHWKKTCVNPDVCGGVCWKKLCADSIRGNILWRTAWFMLDWKELDLCLRKKDFFLILTEWCGRYVCISLRMFLLSWKISGDFPSEMPIAPSSMFLQCICVPLDLCYRKQAFYKQSSLFILMSPLKMLQIAACFVSTKDPSLNKERLIHLSNCL